MRYIGSIRAYMHIVNPCAIFANAQDVAILDVRGRVKTELRSKTANGTRLEMSEYLSDYDMYLEGHIPGNAINS